MGEFRRGLSAKFILALELLATRESWWRDVLQDRDLIIAIRNGYLNVYWRGQAIYTVSWDGEHIRVGTHPKYLCNPELSGQISLDDGTGKFGRLPEGSWIERYEGAETLKKLKTAASLFSGEEKQGVHNVVRANPQIVDVEIAFDARDLETNRNIPRIDIAAVEIVQPGYQLVFWEAKLFANKDLRSQGESAPVLSQVREYEQIALHHRDQILTAYRRVAENLRSISDMSSGSRPLDSRIRAISEGAPLILGEPPRVGVLVFGFDADQRDGANWAVHRNKLRDKLGDRFLGVGNAKDLKLF